MATYIQHNGGEGLETVDEFPTYKEAREAIKEYQMSDSGGTYYLSNRPCKEWAEASKVS